MVKSINCLGMIGGSLKKDRILSIAGYGRIVAVFISAALIGLISLGELSYAQQDVCGIGKQIRGQGKGGQLIGGYFTVQKNGSISRVNNNGDGFWLEGSAGVINFSSTQNPVGTPIQAGKYKVFPNLKPKQSEASVTVCVK